ncbi:MAG TPA: hypothetical protein VGP36_00685 [Mycobacteriales bacterium]|jgi:hypothetical protein|nr:hypothetical protein [Mycobacteriales bacterium]
MKLSRRRFVAILAAGCAVTAATVASPAGAVTGCVPPPGDFEHSIVGPIAGSAATPTSFDSVMYAGIGGDRKVYVADTTVEQPDILVNPLQCLGGGAIDAPAITDYGTGQALYVLAPTGRIYESYLPDTGVKTSWTPVPGAPASNSAPAVAVTPGTATIDLFVRGRDNQVWHATRAGDAGALGTTWSAWENLGGGITGVAAANVQTTSSSLVVVGRAPTGVLYQKSGATGHWGGWVKLTGTTSATPALATGFGAGRLDLFVTGTSTGGLYQSTMLSGATKFTTFKKVDPDLPPGSKLGAAGKNGRMMVYATVRDGADTVVGFDQYVPRLGWSGFSLAPYTCDTCLPTAAAAAARTAKRPVQTKPLG